LRLAERLSALASAYAGYPVRVVLGASRESCDGHPAVTMYEAGSVQIRLANDLIFDDDLFLRAFVHETAHCILRHWRPADDGEDLVECRRRREVEARGLERNALRALAGRTPFGALEELERLAGLR